MPKALPDALSVFQVTGTGGITTQVWQRRPRLGWDPGDSVHVWSSSSSSLSTVRGVRLITYACQSGGSLYVMADRSRGAGSFNLVDHMHSVSLAETIVQTEDPYLHRTATTTPSSNLLPIPQPGISSTRVSPPPSRSTPTAHLTPRRCGRTWTPSQRTTRRCP